MAAAAPAYAAQGFRTNLIFSSVGVQRKICVLPLTFCCIRVKRSRHGQVKPSASPSVFPVGKPPRVM